MDSFRDRLRSFYKVAVHSIVDDLRPFDHLSTSTLSGSPRYANYARQPAAILESSSAFYAVSLGADVKLGHCVSNVGAGVYNEVEVARVPDASSSRARNHSNTVYSVYDALTFTPHLVASSEQKLFLVYQVSVWQAGFTKYFHLRLTLPLA